MKNSETDRELVDLIVRTLENHDEHYILGSWENFVSFRNRRRRNLLLFTFAGIAATFLIGLIGFRVLISDTISYDGKRLNREPAILSSEVFKKINSETYISVDKKTAGSAEGRANYNEDLADAGKSGYGEKHPDDKTGATMVFSADETRGPGKESVNINTLRGLTFRHSPVQSGNLKDVQHKSSSKDSIIYSSDDNDLSTTGNELPINTHTHRLRFGVNISPGVTSTSTVSSFNYSGGINADIKLTENLSISTGIQIEHQNAVNKITDNPSWMPAGKSQAVLTDLDLPLNITWKFLKKGSARYYLTSGISSVAYLSERYVNTSYSQKMTQVVNTAGSAPNVSYLLSNVKNTTQKTEDPLNTFDFAGRVNIIIGIEQPLSSNLYLHIEPFVKIPVTGLASEHMKFTTSGIVCKLSF